MIIQNNFLDSNLLSDIKSDLDLKKSQLGWISYRYLFHISNVVDPDQSGDFHISKPSDHIMERLVNFLVASQPLDDIEIKKENIDTEQDIWYYCADTNSGVGWHTDEIRQGSISLYLNDHWDPDWGGLFCYKYPEDQETVHYIVPESNKAVIHQGPILHCVTKLQPDSLLRESLQIFINKDK